MLGNGMSPSAGMVPPVKDNDGIVGLDLGGIDERRIARFQRITKDVATNPAMEHDDQTKGHEEEFCAQRRRQKINAARSMSIHGSGGRMSALTNCLRTNMRR